MQVPNIEVSEEIVKIERILEGLARVRLHLRQREVSLRRFFKDKAVLYAKPPLNGVRESIMKQLEKMRKDIDKLLTKYAKIHPMWEAFFSHIKGISPIYAGIILGLFPARKFPHPSALRKYVGWAPPEVYPERNYNRMYKTVFYLVAENFILKQNKYSSEYYKWLMKEERLMMEAEKIKKEIEKLKKKKAYEAVKKLQEKLEQMKPPKSKRHAHLRAIRKLISMFLAHYFEMYWRVVLEVENPPEPYFVIRGMGEYFPPEMFFDK